MDGEVGDLGSDIKGGLELKWEAFKRLIKRCSLNLKIFWIGDLCFLAATSTYFFLFSLIAPAGTRRLVPGIVSDCSKFCFCVNLGTLKNYKLWVGEGNIKAQCTRLWKSIFGSRRSVNNVQVPPLRGRETQQCLCFSAAVAAADVAARANSLTTCWRMLGEGRASRGRGPYWLLLARDHWPFSVFCIWSPERDGAKLTASTDIQAAPARRWLGSRRTFRVRGGPRLLAGPTAGGRDDQILLTGR